MALENSGSFTFQDVPSIVWNFGGNRQILNIGVVISELVPGTYRRLGYLVLQQQGTFPAGTYVLDYPIGSIWRPRVFYPTVRQVGAVAAVLYPARGIELSSTMFFVASFA